MEFESSLQAMMAEPDGSAEVTFPWGDATFTFRLNSQQIKKLEAKHNLGLMKMAHLMKDGSLPLQRMEDIIRHGLLGAGMGIENVEGAMRRNFSDQPIEEIIKAAYAIAHHALSGPVLDKTQGKAGRGGQKTKAAASPSPSSSETQPQSA